MLGLKPDRIFFIKFSIENESENENENINENEEKRFQPERKRENYYQFYNQLSQ